MRIHAAFLLAVSLSCLSLSAAEGAILLRQTTATGITGWTKAEAKHSRDGWMNRTLVLRNRNGALKEFHAGYAFIERWDLIEQDRFVVIRSRNAHGPACWQKFEVRSMQVLEEYHYSEGSVIPAWVKPFPH